MQKFMLVTATLLALAAPHAPAQDLTKAQQNLKKFRQISPSIYAGGNPVAQKYMTQGLDALVELGIAAAIDLQGGDVDGTWTGLAASYLQKGEHPDAIAYEREYFESRGVAFFNFPLNSHAPKTPAEDISIRLALVLMSLATPEQPVYIHCEHGADRTGLLIALYRVYYENWDPQLAYAEWVKYGHTRIARIITGDLDEYFWNFTAQIAKERSETAPCAADLNPKN
jgi:protein tyrosine/serine phosphatase